MRQRWDNRFVRSLKLLPIGKSELRSMFRPVDEHERLQLFVGDCVQHSEEVALRFAQQLCCLDIKSV